jgi:hypothetical protein
MKALMSESEIEYSAMSANSTAFAGGYRLILPYIKS